MFANASHVTGNGFFSSSNEQPKKTGGLFDNLKADADKPSTGFFGNGQASSLFGNPSQEPAKKTGLFDNLLTQPNTTNPEVKPTKSGLFDGLLNPNMSNNTGCGTNLFSNSQTPLSGIFAKTEGSNTADAGEDDEEVIEGDEDEVPGQEDKSDPTKSRGNYKYESKTETILSVD